jgi:hypothetical protein
MGYHVGLSSIKHLQGKIITGNSTKMKTLAVTALKKHNFDYQIMTDGSILVNGTVMSEQYNEWNYKLYRWLQWELTLSVQVH